MRTLIGDTAGDFRCCWKPLFLTDVIYKVVAFVLLTPRRGYPGTAFRNDYYDNDRYEN